MKTSIKKFKNGNINIKVDLTVNSHYVENGWLNVDKFYNQELTMNDLYFYQINGYSYLVDNNTQRVYDFSYNSMDVLRYLGSELIEGNGKMTLYPLTKKESRSLLEDLENGY